MLGRRKMTTFKEQGARKKTRGKGGEKRLEESEGEKEETKKLESSTSFWILCDEVESVVLSCRKRK